MADPDAVDRRPGRWRIVVLALVFALFAHGCLVVTVSLTVDPF